MVVAAASRRQRASTQKRVMLWTTENEKRRPKKESPRLWERRGVNQGYLRGGGAHKSRAGVKAEGYSERGRRESGKLLRYLVKDRAAETGAKTEF